MLRIEIWTIAFQEGKPILDPKYYANIDINDIKCILREDQGTGEIPLIDQRMNNLREAGQVLINKYQGIQFFPRLNYQPTIILHFRYFCRVR